MDVTHDFDIISSVVTLVEFGVNILNLIGAGYFNVLYFSRRGYLIHSNKEVTFK